MSKLLPPVRVVHSADVRVEPPGDPVEYITAPYAITTALQCDTLVPIVTSDSKEGARRALPTHEAALAGLVVVGPGGGETWHTHLSYYDIIFYVVSGTGNVWWEAGGIEHIDEIGPGDFVHIAPSARQQWLNTGADDLRIAWFGHFHNYPEQ